MAAGGQGGPPPGDVKDKRRADCRTAEPPQAFLGAEIADRDDRQQALRDLRTRHRALVALLDDRQRATLSALFTATRGDLRS